MNLTIFLLLLHVFLVKSEEKKEGECPISKSRPEFTCTAERKCPNGFLCYRDVISSSSGDSGCCRGHCSTGMMFGVEYLPENRSVIADCDTQTDRYYPETPEKSARICCPVPISAFLHGKSSGPLVQDEFWRPRGFQVSNNTAVGFQTCTNSIDCATNEYCGKVRGPAGPQFSITRDKDHSKIFLRFCFTKPPLADYSLALSSETNFDEFQLCQKNSDCWSSSQYCKREISTTIGVCAPLKNLFYAEGIEEWFLADQEKGCQQANECERNGKNWFSYECVAAGPNRNTLLVPNICVGYDIHCSESALRLRGTNFGCHTDDDCAKDWDPDNIHTPRCVNDTITRRTACCYEMNSCLIDRDLKPYGISPIGRRMCSGDEECQVLANRTKEQMDGPDSRNLYWGRCMQELENGWGKCCIANITDLCSVGRPLLPPQNCTTDAHCGGKERTSQWCSTSSGFCCQDYPGESSYLCPDLKTVRREQPACDSPGYCNFGTGVCLLDRCCPLMNREKEKLLVWSEKPWYFPEHPCFDTADLPAHLEMVYCDPKRNLTTRISRSDRWLQPIRATDRYCTSNSNCSLTFGLVCVKEIHGIQRCHTYYNRDFPMIALIFPTIVFLALSLTYYFHWHRQIDLHNKEPREVIR
ncbi:unnamed protein product [Caenorhabditis sp. 36 PRJEB53466]|nr:unnamed protein product [Caenorhabditis sp. 36 PRJEB53466]